MDWMRICHRHFYPHRDFWITTLICCQTRQERIEQSVGVLSRLVGIRRKIENLWDSLKIHRRPVSLAPRKITNVECWLFRVHLADI